MRWASFCTWLPWGWMAELQSITKYPSRFLSNSITLHIPGILGESLIFFGDFLRSASTRKYVAWHEWSLITYPPLHILNGCVVWRQSGAGYLRSTETLHGGWGGNWGLMKAGVTWIVPMYWKMCCKLAGWHTFTYCFNLLLLVLKALNIRHPYGVSWEQEWCSQC